MYPSERHASIVARARAEGRVEVAGLARDLDVATETIRRDLTILERRGNLRRVHGGAVPVERLGLEPSVREREVVNTAAKDAIAAAALAAIGDVATIVLDGGTTTARLAAMLPTDREITVVTHALPIASIVAVRPNVRLHLAGGHVRGRTLVAVGPWATQALSRIKADVVILGANGISREQGVTTPDVAEAEVKAALAAAARRVVVLADHSKIGRDELITVLPCEEIDTLITDTEADAELISEIEAAGVDVVRAPPTGTHAPPGR
ncbi:D-beta-D-heptose 1-phosphate adenosyltransferase [Serinibacter arcticus]|uniref:Lactose phosphotransferase system repressor n=1 Tax=Serinibacter arcticus TaxID=1655435 RepID=A0A2U1ZU08_9MICO|nr:DeoR/GlpR family DNA-binding transcription regulator [Serinibacter arcticus]PWD50412.1 D-beta-D-heptose 1-phosphate adenosyltransferase [Serinibacter arcticus]